MAKMMTIQEVSNVLENGDFENLKGAMESEVLEFKSAPYQLDTLKLKLELAKDVSALANVRGGIIVMGIKTCVQKDHPYEIVEEIRSFTNELIDIKQYENIIAEWIYPRPNLEIKWAPSSQDTEKGIAYIKVPESETKRKPFLATNILTEDDKILGNVVGFFERKGDKVIHWSTEELYHTFKDGLRFDEYLSETIMAKRNGISPDELLLERAETIPRTATRRKTSRPVGTASDSVNEKIESAIEAVGLRDSISYVLVSSPDTKMEIPGLFESRTSDIVKLIDEPPILRNAGFDIRTEERSKIVNGELRRSHVKPYKLLEVWRDGTVIFVADGEGYLCWGNSEGEEFLWINTLTLIETGYLFSLFVKNIFEVAKAPDCNVQMQLQVRNIPKSRKYGLSKAKPKLRWLYDLDMDIVWTSLLNVGVIKSWELRRTTPEKAAYELVSELYVKFGVEHEFIPYVKECEGEKVIDIEGIKSI